MLDARFTSNRARRVNADEIKKRGWFLSWTPKDRPTRRFFASAARWYKLDKAWAPYIPCCRGSPLVRSFYPSCSWQISIGAAVEVCYIRAFTAPSYKRLAMGGMLIEKRRG